MDSKLLCAMDDVEVRVLEDRTELTHRRVQFPQGPMNIREELTHAETYGPAVRRDWNLAESAIYAFEHGMRCWNVGDELFERDAVGTSDVDGQTRELPGLIVCHRNDEEAWSGANQTH